MHAGEFVSKENVRQQIQKLDSYRKKAQQSEHLLEWTLHDMTENLALYYQNTAKESMMPNPQLEVTHTLLITYSCQACLMHCCIIK